MQRVNLERNKFHGDWNYDLDKFKDVRRFEPKA